MMKFNIIILLVGILIFGNVQSQELSNSEKKSLKKEIKNLLRDPIRYKKLKESIKKKDKHLRDNSFEINSKTRDNNKLKHQLIVARDSIGDFAFAIDRFKENETKSKSAAECKDDSGMKYRLQIGLYKDYDISSFFEQFKYMTFEKTEENYFRYIIGNFNSENEAEIFKDAIRRMGIRDAWVSYYLDGNRIPKE